MAVDKVALREWFDTTLVPNENISVEDYSGYGGYDFVSEVKTISNALSGNTWGAEIPMPDVPMAPHLLIDITSDSDGIIDGFVMSIPTEDWPYGDREPVLGFLPTYITRYLDQKSATDDREATGTEAAWAIVSALVDEWERLVDVVVKVRTALGIPVG